nr:multicopper oxidase domain-containing protein [Streptomyces sp. NBC_00886]
MDGKVYDPARVDAFARYGASEAWTVVNADEVFPHNFHMYLVQFRTLKRNGQSPPPLTKASRTRQPHAEGVGQTAGHV